MGTCCQIDDNRNDINKELKIENISSNQFLPININKNQIKLNLNNELSNISTNKHTFNSKLSIEIIESSSINLPIGKEIFVKKANFNESWFGIGSDVDYIFPYDESIMKRHFCISFDVINLRWILGIYRDAIVFYRLYKKEVMPYTYTILILYLYYIIIYRSSTNTQSSTLDLTKSVFK